MHPLKRKKKNILMMAASQLHTPRGSQNSLLSVVPSPKVRQDNVGIHPKGKPFTPRVPRPVLKRALQGRAGSHSVRPGPNGSLGIKGGDWLKRKATVPKQAYFNFS